METEIFPNKSHCKVECKSKDNKKIKLLSQIIIKSPNSPASSVDTFNVNTDTECIAETSLNNVPKHDCSPLKTNYDSMSDEDKSSESEYVPSDDEHNASTSTEEENTILSVKNNKKSKNNTIICKKNKNILLTKNIPSKKVDDDQIITSTVEPEVHEVPDSTTSRPIEIATSSMQPSKDFSNIKILAATKAKGKLIRNKGHACYYCQRIVQNSARHFELMHVNEMDVAKLLAKPKYSKQRRDGFANLIRAGDFYHNTDVLSTKKGHLILIRRPTEDEAKFVTSSEYGPCPHCLGFMLKKHLWHHVKNSCTAKIRNDANNNRHIIAEIDALLNYTFGSDFSRDFVTNIISKLRDDEIGLYCKEDILVQRYGAMLFEKYGTTQCEMIRQSMRQLVRLTLKLHEITDTKKQLSDFLVPQMFDSIIQATKSLCVIHQNTVRRPEFELPSLALKTGYALKKFAGIKRGSYLRAGNLSGNKTLTCFLSLMELEWNSNALATLYNRKINATQLLPLTSDLIKLSQYLNSQMKKVYESLSECISIKSWSLLASLTLTKIILFNKRRSGEAARMTISDYSSRPKWADQCTDELKKSLSEFERKLGDQLTLVEIVGKRGRRVPVLLTQDVKTSIDKLNQTRDEINIDNENCFVFARTGNSTANMRGHECLRKACSDAGLEHAENITSTMLRKYIATVCQVFNLSENDYDWLARHLGHDIRVHREFYRLHESAVELTKISRLLIAVDKGEVNTFAGKKLEDINLEDIPNAEEESEDEENINDEREATVENKDIKHEEESNAMKRQKISSEQYVAISSYMVAPREAQAKTKEVKRRRPWSSEEKEAVLNFFKYSIKRGMLPGKADCMKCIEKNSTLSRRTWTDIKFCIKNHLSRIRKIVK